MKPVEQAKRPKKVSYEVAKNPVSQSISSVQGVLPEVAEEGNLEKIRDILFGTQSREFDERCSLLEKKLMQESADLKGQFTQSLEDIKVYVKGEVSRLTSQIQEERDGRSNSVEEVGLVIKALGSQLESRVSGLHDQTTTKHQVLERQLAQHKSESVEHQKQALADMQGRFQEAVNALKAEKTDRAVLAEMFMDVALQLKVGQREHS